MFVLVGARNSRTGDGNCLAACSVVSCDVNSIPRCSRTLVLCVYVPFAFVGIGLGLAGSGLAHCGWCLKFKRLWSGHVINSPATSNSKRDQASTITTA